MCGFFSLLLLLLLPDLRKIAYDAYPTFSVLTFLCQWIVVMQMNLLLYHESWQRRAKHHNSILHCIFMENDKSKQITVWIGPNSRLAHLSPSERTKTNPSLDRKFDSMQQNEDTTCCHFLFPIDISMIFCNLHIFPHFTVVSFHVVIIFFSPVNPLRVCICLV